MRPNEITYKVIGAAMKVHSALGPGLLESAYEKALCNEFTNQALRFRRQVKSPIVYDSVKIENAFTADFIVEELIVIEIKCVVALLAVHRAQLFSYLKLTKLPLGLLLNFKVAHMRDRITRIINAPEADL